MIEVANSSDRTADYYIEVEFVDGSGTSMGVGNAFIDRVAAGQTVRREFTGTLTRPEDVTAKETTVQRTPS